MSASPPSTSHSPSPALTPCLSSSPRRLRSRSLSHAGPSGANAAANLSMQPLGVRWADELPDVRLALVNVFVERDLEREDWDRLGLDPDAHEGIAGQLVGRPDEWWQGVARRYRKMKDRQADKIRTEASTSKPAMDGSAQASRPIPIKTSDPSSSSSTSASAHSTEARSWRVVYHDECESPDATPYEGSPFSSTIPLPSTSLSSSPTSTRPLSKRLSSLSLSRNSPYSPMWAPPSLALRMPPPTTSAPSSRSASNLSSLASSPSAHPSTQLPRDLVDEAATRALNLYCRAGRGTKSPSPSPSPNRNRNGGGHRRARSWDDADVSSSPFSSLGLGLLGHVLRLASGNLSPTSPTGGRGRSSGYLDVDGNYIDGDTVDHAAAEEGEDGEDGMGLAARARDNLLSAIEWAIEFPTRVAEGLAVDEDDQQRRQSLFDGKRILSSIDITTSPSSLEPSPSSLAWGSSSASLAESDPGYDSDHESSSSASSDEYPDWGGDDSALATPLGSEREGSSEGTYFRKRSITDLVEIVMEKEEEEREREEQERLKRLVAAAGSGGRGRRGSRSLRGLKMTQVEGEEAKGRKVHGHGAGKKAEGKEDGEWGLMEFL